MNWSVWLSSNTPGTRPVLNGCQLPQSQPVICLGVLPCQAENSLKAEPPTLCSCGDRGPGHFFPAPKLSYEIIVRRERVKETVGPKRDYRLRRHLINTHPQNCEESWANWSVDPELRTVKYSTMPHVWASGFHIWTCPVMVQATELLDPLCGRGPYMVLDISASKPRLNIKQMRVSDEEWLWLSGISNNWRASFNFFFNSENWTYTCEASTLLLTYIPYPLLMLDFETEPH